MDRINLTRVVVGGLAAGLLINVSEFILNGVVLAADMQTAMARLNLTPPGGSAMALFVILGFVVGTVLVWLYAAMRPRFGAGARTAVYAGLAVWFLAYLYPSLGMSAMGMFPTSMLTLGVIWGLVEVLIASLVGAWLYTEEGSTVRVAV